MTEIEDLGKKIDDLTESFKSPISRKQFNKREIISYSDTSG